MIRKGWNSKASDTAQYKNQDDGNADLYRNALDLRKKNDTQSSNSSEDQLYYRQLLDTTKELYRSILYNCLSSSPSLEGDPLNMNNSIDNNIESNHEKNGSPLEDLHPFKINIKPQKSESNIKVNGDENSPLDLSKKFDSYSERTVTNTSSSVKNQSVIRLLSSARCSTNYRGSSDDLSEQLNDADYFEEKQHSLTFNGSFKNPPFSTKYPHQLYSADYNSRKKHLTNHARTPSDKLNNLYGLPDDFSSNLLNKFEYGLSSTRTNSSRSTVPNSYHKKSSFKFNAVYGSANNLSNHLLNSSTKLKYEELLSPIDTSSSISQNKMTAVFNIDQGLCCGKVSDMAEKRKNIGTGSDSCEDSSYFSGPPSLIDSPLIPASHKNNGGKEIYKESEHKHRQQVVEEEVEGDYREKWKKTRISISSSRATPPRVNQVEGTLPTDMAASYRIQLLQKKMQIPADVPIELINGGYGIKNPLLQNLNQTPLPLSAEIIQENNSHGSSTPSSLMIKSEFNGNSHQSTTTDHNFNITTLDTAEKTGNDVSGNGRLKVIACQICGKQFTYMRLLKRHLKCHSLLKRYLCTYCCKGFNDTFDLKRHTRTHTGVKPYKCQMCDKSFTQRCSLESHNRKLHGLQMKYGYKERREKLYVCEECGFTSNRLDGHVEHLNKFCIKRREKLLQNANNKNVITENKDNVFSENSEEKDENSDKANNFLLRKALSMKPVPMKEERRQPFSGSLYDFTNDGSDMEQLHCYHGSAKRNAKNNNDNNVCSLSEDSNYSTFSGLSFETTSREKKYVPEMNVNRNEIRHILKEPMENKDCYGDKLNGNIIYPYNLSKTPQTYDDYGSNSLQAFIMRCQRALMPNYCNPNNLKFDEVESMRELDAISLNYYFYYANGFPIQSTYNHNLPPTLPPFMHSHIYKHH
ncbi:unnamed protein product [Gordionus sp. m RMFG-2023]